MYGLEYILRIQVQKDKELNMSSDGSTKKYQRSDYKPTVTSILIDKELCFQGETNHRDIVRIKGRLAKAGFMVCIRYILL